MKKKIYVLGGGTMVKVAPHFSFCSPAYGSVGLQISEKLNSDIKKDDLEYEVQFVPTKMALDKLYYGQSGNIKYSKNKFKSHIEYVKLLDKAGLKKLETNSDMKHLVDYLKLLPSTRCIIMSSAICDFKPSSISDSSSYIPIYDHDHMPRLKSNINYEIGIKGDDKIISSIRKERKDIFLVGFKTTSGVGKGETYRLGLESLKKNSCNLVLANDIKNKINMVITPEEYPYQADSREDVVSTLCEMVIDRIQLTFTRTKVKEGKKADINLLSEMNNIPSNFVEVLKYLIDKGAYKPFMGKTTGHFGCKVEDKPYERISSIRKVDHNKVFENGMAKIYGHKGGKILAKGGKPSVGEHTQQMIYSKHKDIDCIVHFHCPLKEGSHIPTANQKPYECGSNECGLNTVNNMKEVLRGVYIVHLDNHGPNIGFSRKVRAEYITRLIEENWDLSDKEGGLIKNKD